MGKLQDHYRLFDVFMGKLNDEQKKILEELEDLLIAEEILPAISESIAPVLGTLRRLNIKTVCTIIALSLCLVSCTNKKQRYTLTITSNDKSIGIFTEKTKTEEIVAENDSIAYAQAYLSFCTSKKISHEMIEKGYNEMGEGPVSFKITDAEGKELTPISEDVLALIEEDVLNTVMTEGLESIKVEIDSAVYNKLSPKFTFKKEEFDARNIVWIKPRNKPQYSNINGIYCYFATLDGKAVNFRMKIQYAADRWLFIRNYVFNVDGQIYTFNPVEVKRDHDSTIWEWCDEAICESSDVALVKALATAKDVKIQFRGQDYNKSRTLSRKEIQAISDTYNLYIAMGGNF